MKYKVIMILPFLDYDRVDMNDGGLTLLEALYHVEVYSKRNPRAIFEIEEEV